MREDENNDTDDPLCAASGDPIWRHCRQEFRPKPFVFYQDEQGFHPCGLENDREDSKPEGVIHNGFTSSTRSFSGTREFVLGQIPNR